MSVLTTTDLCTWMGRSCDVQILPHKTDGRTKRRKLGAHKILVWMTAHAGNLEPSKHTDSSWVARAVRACSRMDDGTLRILEEELPVLNFGFSFKLCVYPDDMCTLF